MLTIGEFSKLAKTTVRTLRFYDEIGLFKPSYIAENGYRFYTETDLEKLAQILKLRALGLTLDEIKGVCSGGDLAVALTNRLATLEREVKIAQNNVTLIKNWLKELQGDEKMSNYKATEKLIPSYKVYYRHGTIANMSEMFDFILQAGEECRQNNPTLKCSPDDYCYVTYEAEEYRETDVELEYVEAVETFGKESENIRFKTVPQIKAVCVEHVGPYSKLGEAYAFALNYVKQNGYEMSDKIREVYVHGCWDTSDENDYLTVIQVPVR